MNEDNHDQNEQHTEEQQHFDKTQAEYREISQVDLERVLASHQKWLDSDKKEGSKADLSNFNLKKANLFKANLQESNITNANLQEINLARSNIKKANLFKAHLKKAHLFKTNMQQTNLFSCNLQQANLFQADLKQSILATANMKDANLAGANFQNTNLNRVDMQNAVLDGVQGLNEANLRYANLEGATGLLGNEFAQADLTGTKLPDDIKEFRALETVEKISQNARKIFFAMLLVCVYSWLTIATTTDVRLLTNTASSPLPIIQTEIPISGFYLAAPLVLICLYLYFHLYLDNLWKSLAGLPAIFPDGKPLDQTAYPWLLNSLVCRHFERLKKRPEISHMKEWITIFLAWWVVPITMIAFWLRYIPRHDWWATIFHLELIFVTVAFAIFFYRLCALTLKGKERKGFSFNKLWSDRRFYYVVSVALVGVLFSLLSYGAIEGVRPPFQPILIGRIIIMPNKSETQINFTNIKELVPWVFKKITYDVFADFRESIISEISTNYSMMPKVEWFEFVKGANLQDVDLRNADMHNSFLVKSDFRNAKINGANLIKANLQHANFAVADLREALLIEANLSNAILHFARLQKANLNDAELHIAEMINANLEEAELLGANLHNANFSGADLSGAKNLTIEQLSKVKTLYQAKLDPELLEQVKKCCPHLLEEPKEETDQTN